MTTPSEKIAESLERLKELQDAGVAGENRPNAFGFVHQ